MASTAAKKAAASKKAPVIDRTTMIIPTGKFKGALPDNILINGARWVPIKTGTVKGRTYDKIENVKTGERKTYERPVLLAFLRKNWNRWQKKSKKNIVKSDNSYTFEQHNEEVKTQKAVFFPKVDF